MPTSRWLLVVPVVVTGAIVACNLNPQPLPPSDDTPASGIDNGSSGGFRGDGDETADPAPASPADGGTGAVDGDGGDAGDAGDASDGGDAGDETDSG